MRSFTIAMCTAICMLSSAPGRADEAPVAGPGALCSTSAPLALVADGLSRPEPDDCSAEVWCPTAGGGGYTLECHVTGSGTCTAGVYRVTCDGQTTNCSCRTSVFCGITCICNCYLGGGSQSECTEECCG